MASVINSKNGRRAVQFTAADGRRPILRLGKVSKAHAELVREHVEELVAAVKAGRAERWETAAWVKGADPQLHARLVRAGLVVPRPGEEPVPLESYLKGYIEKRTDIKPLTRASLEQAKGKLVGFFGANRDIRNITRGDAADWRRWLQKTLSPATVGMHVKKARQFFADALDRKHVAENPFKGLKAGNQANAARQCYVPAADIKRVMDACPDAGWRLLFALSRYAGLRVPSETLRLVWADVDWANARFTVRSPKTEHHEGRASRVVPIFPELRPYLEAVRAEAEPGARHVLSRRAANTRATAKRIIKRAGLPPWERVFHNLRASCQTDLSAKHPLHVVCAWLGNTQAVASRHYLQVTEADFAAAAEGAAKSAAKDHRGTPRFTGETRKNAGKYGETAAPDYSHQESQSPRKSRGKPGGAHQGDAAGAANPTRPTENTDENSTSCPGRGGMSRVQYRSGAGSEEGRPPSLGVLGVRLRRLRAHLRQGDRQQGEGPDPRGEVSSALSPVGGAATRLPAGDSRPHVGLTPDDNSDCDLSHVTRRGRQLHARGLTPDLRRAERGVRAALKVMKGGGRHA